MAFQLQFKVPVALFEPCDLTLVCGLPLLTVEMGILLQGHVVVIATRLSRFLLLCVFFLRPFFFFVELHRAELTAPENAVNLLIIRRLVAFFRIFFDGRVPFLGRDVVVISACWHPESGSLIGPVLRRNVLGGCSPVKELHVQLSRVLNLRKLTVVLHLKLVTSVLRPFLDLILVLLDEVFLERIDSTSGCILVSRRLDVMTVTWGEPGREGVLLGSRVSDGGILVDCR